MVAPTAATSRRGGGIIAAGPFSRGVGMQRQRVHALVEGGLERVLRQAVATNQWQAFEAVADHDHPEMALDTIASVLVGFIENFEMTRSECRVQCGLDPLCTCRHGVQISSRMDVLFEIGSTLNARG